VSGSKDQTYSIYTLLKEVFLLLDHGDRNLFQTYDLSVARFNALKHVIYSAGIGPSELGSLMLCDKANITRLLDGMEKSSYIERLQDEADGRRIKIIARPEGERRWRKAREKHGKFTRNRFDVLAADEQDMLFELLMRIRDRLQNLIEGEQTETQLSP
jgi:DNA-binding MarR family transcriptional regulator